MTNHTCSIDGCDKPKAMRGWCNMHYRRWYRNGDPLDYGSRIYGDTEARFWAYTQKGGAGECWEWTGHKSADGYGVLRVNRATAYMPRYSYELRYGTMPLGTEPDHKCRNRACVNPEHLEAVTHKVNVLRGESPTAINARKTHCIRGHEFTVENTRRDKRGGRNCRTCLKMHERARYGKKTVNL